MPQETYPLSLTGDGYSLTIHSDASRRKDAALAMAQGVTSVTDNDESADAAFVKRKLAALRIEVEKSRKLVKEPIIAAGRAIDKAAADFMAALGAEEQRLDALISTHAIEVAEMLAAAKQAELEAYGTLDWMERLEASDLVHATRLPDGVTMVWDFEVTDISLVYRYFPELVTLTIRRADTLDLIKKTLPMELYSTANFAAMGLHVFQTPKISST